MREKLTAAQKEKITELRSERGLTYKQIALRIGRAEGTVSDYCLTRAIEPPTIKNLEIRPAEAYTYKRGGFSVKGFTKEEDEIIQSMLLSNKRNVDISRALGRAQNSVRARIIILARREERKFILEHSGDL